MADERTLLPTLKPAGFDASHCPTSCCSPCGSTQPSHPKDAVAAGYVSTPHRGFDVGPRYFPGVVRVQRLRQSALVLRLGYIDPAESFAFPLPACTSPTSKRAGYSFQPVSGFMLRNACNPPLATSGDQPGSVVVAPRRRFDVGPRLSGVSCHLSPSDLSRNRTAPLPTKPRQASRNRTGTFFVGGRR